MKRTLEELKASRCNDRAIAKTVEVTGESKQLVEHTIQFLHEFIAGRIAEGSFESVRIEKFGTFKPKLKRVQWINHNKGLSPMYKKLLAANIKRLKDKSKLKNPDNEAIDNQSGLPGDRAE